MARTKGATNQEKLPEEVRMSEERRIALVADLILQIILEEKRREDVTPR